VGGACPTSGADCRIDPRCALRFIPQQARRTKFAEFYAGVAGPAASRIDDGDHHPSGFLSPSQPGRNPGGGGLADQPRIEGRIAVEYAGALSLQPTPHRLGARLVAVGTERSEQGAQLVRGWGQDNGGWLPASAIV
jgi:hypothetical protein